MKISIFNVNTGQILRTCSVPVGFASMQCSDGEDWIEGAFPDDSYFIQNNTAFHCGDRPTAFHVFDFITKQWIDPRTLSDLKQTKWQEIKSQRSSIESEGFSCYNKVFDSDAISQSRIQGAVQLAQLAISTNQPFLITWTLQDNSTIDLDASQMIEVGIALGAHITNTHTRARELRTLIEQARTKEELDLITW